jgi:nucleoside-diphosphate-sugar epimerase
MKILVTGAAGKLGSVTVRVLVEGGHDVRATDRKFAAGSPQVEPSDLLEEHGLYRLLDGVEALVHLGNHPNRLAGPSPQRILAENVAMNANAFTAALDVGVRRIVFSSSIQVMLKSDGIRSDRSTMPYFPLDGDAPPNPGLNPYALSKQFAEEQLATAARELPDLAATSLRFPMLVGEWWNRRIELNGGRLRHDELHLNEATAHLTFPDAARVILAAVEKQAPGYHCYFPAQTLDISNRTPAQIASEFFPSTRVTVPSERLVDLIDRSALERDLGFRPKDRFAVELRDDG